MACPHASFIFPPGFSPIKLWLRPGVAGRLFYRLAAVLTPLRITLGCTDLRFFLSPTIVCRSASSTLLRKCTVTSCPVNDQDANGSGLVVTATAAYPRNIHHRRCHLQTCIPPGLPPVVGSSFPSGTPGGAWWFPQHRGSGSAPRRVRIGQSPWHAGHSQRQGVNSF